MRETANQAPRGRKIKAGACQPPANKIYIPQQHKKSLDVTRHQGIPTHLKNDATSESYFT